MNCVYNGFEAFLNHVFSPVQGVRQKSTRPHFIVRGAKNIRTYFMRCLLYCDSYCLETRHLIFPPLHSCTPAVVAVCLFDNPQFLVAML